MESCAAGQRDREEMGEGGFGTNRAALAVRKCWERGRTRAKRGW